MAAAMRSVRGELQALFPAWMRTTSRAAAASVPLTEVNPRSNVDADFSYSGAIQLSKQRGGGAEFATPVLAAQHVQASLQASSIASVSLAQFHVNFKLTDSFLASRIAALAVRVPPLLVHSDEDQVKRVTIDFSSPNIAKEMHVGHLRSTLIGNALALVHDFTHNHQVRRVNHLGDWGAQFGLLLAQIEDELGPGEQASIDRIKHCSLAQLTQLYRTAKLRNETDQEFALRAKQCVVLLQSGQRGVPVWRALVDQSLKHFTATYTRLGLTVGPGGYEEWFVGESFYQQHMPALYAKEQESGDGLAIVTEEGVVLRKSDGSIGYDATDVAALVHRAGFSDQVLYVVDAGQALHFDKIFAYVQRRWTNGEQVVEPVHVKFGLVSRQGEAKKIKTREGHSPSLVQLLDDAAEVTRSRLFGSSAALAEHVGVASVCFAELKTNRTLNYEFSLDRTCNPDGDGAMYLYYVLAKLERQPTTSSSSSRHRQLELLVCKFHDAVEQVLVTHSPHHLCAYLLHLCHEASGALEQQENGMRPELQLATRNVLVQGMRLLGLSLPSTWPDAADWEFLRTEQYRRRRM